MNVTQLVNKVLAKKAKGYTVKEKIDEYVVVDGVLTLNKRKIVTKNVAPDIAAVKALIELSVAPEQIESMTDEQLQAEKVRLLNVLSQLQSQSDEINIKENIQDD